MRMIVGLQNFLGGVQSGEGMTRRLGAKGEDFYTKWGVIGKPER